MGVAAGEFAIFQMASFENVVTIVLQIKANKSDTIEKEIKPVILLLYAPK